MDNGYMEETDMSPFSSDKDKSDTVDSDKVNHCGGYYVCTFTIPLDLALTAF